MSPVRRRWPRRPALQWRIDLDAAAKGTARAIVDPIHVLVERIYHERSVRYRRTASTA